MPTKRGWVVPVTSVAAVLGVLLAVQFRTQAEVRAAALPARRVQDLALALKAQEEANVRLAKDLKALRAAANVDGPMGGADQLEALEGPGLAIRVVETASISPEGGNGGGVGAEDLLKLVNELRSGGAEAITLNGKRLAEHSEIITAGSHILVNQSPVGPPYELKAIGPAEEMQRVLGLRGGVVEYLQFYGVQVRMSPKAKLQVPAIVLPPLRFAQPAKAGDVGPAQGAGQP